jgi:2-methylisocitrate lyase-like PEP mutase family enzyme
MSLLKQRLSEPRVVIAPGVFDMVSLRLADQAGFDLLYMTGFGVAASYMGLPDAGLTTYTEMVSRVAAMAGAAKTPLIADGDTGFGGLINVRHTVRGYEAAGAAGIQLEDQEMPKKCGHMQGRRVVPLEDMVRKVRVAVEARRSDDFLIIARTDARSAHGLDDAMRRIEAYAKAGADVLFLESPESEEEMARIGKAFDLPLVANMAPGGRTPALTPERLQELGFRIVLYPVNGLLAGALAMKQAYQNLKEGKPAPALMPFSDFNTMVGFPEIWDFEKRHVED